MARGEARGERSAPEGGPVAATRGLSPPPRADPRTVGEAWHGSVQPYILYDDAAKYRAIVGELADEVERQRRQSRPVTPHASLAGSRSREQDSVRMQLQRENRLNVNLAKLDTFISAIDRQCAAALAPDAAPNTSEPAGCSKAALPSAYPALRTAGPYSNLLLHIESDAVSPGERRAMQQALIEAQPLQARGGATSARPSSGGREQSAVPSADAAGGSSHLHATLEKILGALKQFTVGPRRLSSAARPCLSRRLQHVAPRDALSCARQSQRGRRLLRQ